MTDRYSEIAKDLFKVVEASQEQRQSVKRAMFRYLYSFESRTVRLDEEAKAEENQVPVEIECCYCCNFETRDLRNYPDHDGRTGMLLKQNWLCELCASTMASVAQRYPDQYRGQVEIMRMICHVGNTIIRAIKESKT